MSHKELNALIFFYQTLHLHYGVDGMASINSFYFAIFWKP